MGATEIFLPVALIVFACLTGGVLSGPGGNLKSNVDKLDDSNLNIQTPYVERGSEQELSDLGAMNMHLQIVKSKNPNESSVVYKDGVVQNPSNTVEPDNFVEDLAEDQNDLFIATRKGKQRVKYLPEWMVQDEHLEPYVKVNKFKSS